MEQAVIVNAPTMWSRVARITVEQYHQMAEARILREGEPIELIDGMLVYKDRSAGGEDVMTIGKKHNLVIKLLNRIDRVLEGYGVHMQTQGPVTIGTHHEPEPDGVILKGSPRDYAEDLPGPNDVYSIIEVADSSLEYDRTIKLSMYAEASIPQYIIINLVDQHIETYEEPDASSGRYRKVQTTKSEDDVVFLLGPGRHLRIKAQELLP
jgi:hypothetical protein